MWIHWPFFFKNLNQRSLTPRWPLTPCLLRSHVWLYLRIIVSKSHETISKHGSKRMILLLPWSKYVDTVTLFFKNLNQRSLNPRWPLTPCLLRSHVWLYPRIIVFKSHENTSMYVDTVINFAKLPHTTYTLRTYYIHTYYTTYRMSDHIVSYWAQFRWDKNKQKVFPVARVHCILTTKSMMCFHKPCKSAGKNYISTWTCSSHQ